MGKKPYVRCGKAEETLLTQYSSVRRRDGSEYFFIPAVFKRVTAEKGVYEELTLEEIPDSVRKQFINQLLPEDEVNKKEE